MNPHDVEKRILIPPSGYEPAVARWVSALEDARGRTKAALAGLSQVVLDWSPPEGGNSIGAILYHLAAIEMSYVYEDILGVGWSDELTPLLPYDIRDEQGQMIMVKGENLEQQMDRLDATRNLTLRALMKISSDDLYRVRKLPEYETTPEWVLHHLMQHEAEHRGQIGELRLRAGQARS
jgi:uncharacterized damage-inducible protein DinB